MLSFLRRQLTALSLATLAMPRPSGGRSASSEDTAERALTDRFQLRAEVALLRSIPTGFRHTRHERAATCTLVSGGAAFSSGWSAENEQQQQCHRGGARILEKNLLRAALNEKLNRLEMSSDHNRNQVKRLLHASHTVPLFTLQHSPSKSSCTKGRRELGLQVRLQTISRSARACALRFFT